MQGLSLQIVFLIFLCPGAPAPPWPSAVCIDVVMANVNSNTESAIESKLLENIERNFNQSR